MVNKILGINLIGVMMSANRLPHDRMIKLTVAVAVFNVLCLATFVAMERFGVVTPSLFYFLSTVSANLMIGIAFHLWFQSATQAVNIDDESSENS